ncbi:MAG TPA: peptide MFS transporter [Thermoanaerobaculia bacterium]|nr:peptide MFS transporter [Thermoanaerobaculia bacterium]
MAVHSRAIDQHPALSAEELESAARAERHPPGLVVLFATEMWERFSFYSMLAMFTLYLQNPDEGFGWPTARATRLYALYLACVYFSPLIGGWLADRKLGYRRSVVIGGLFFIAGHLFLSFRSVPIVYLALACLVIGNGFFKPNVSTMVGKLYPEGSPLKDRAYSIFYMGINVGAFVAPLVAEVVRSRFGYHPAFAVAAGGMVISVAILWRFRRHLDAADRGPAAEEEAGALQPIDAVSDARRIGALLVLFLIVIVFWMAFHQNGSTWTYWANDNTDWASSAVVPVIFKVLTLGLIEGTNVSGVIANAIEPFFVIVLTFPLIAFWSWLGRRGLEPSTPAKMAIGMLLVAGAYLVMARGGFAGGDTGRVSPWWLISAYAVITLGELMISPMGLSLVSKVAPVRLRGLMMGGWFAATSVGNYLVGTIGVKWTVWPHSRFFLVIATMATGVSVLLFILLRPLKKAMPGI